MARQEPWRRLWQRYFWLTPREIMVLGLVLALFLLGLVSRYWYLRQQQSQVLKDDMLESTD